MKKDDRQTLAWVLFGGALLFAMRPRSAAAAPAPQAPAQPAAELPPDREARQPDTAAEARDVLRARQRALLGFGARMDDSPLRQLWDAHDLAYLTYWVGRFMDVAPELLWGLMFRESGHLPVGVFGNRDTPGTATEYGMAQMTWPRFRAEHDAPSSDYNAQLAHVDLIHPTLALVSAAESYLRGAAKHGGDVSFNAFGFGDAMDDFMNDDAVAEWPGSDMSSLPAWAGAWWARPADLGSGTMSEGSARKQADILTEGPQVGPLVGNIFDPDAPGGARRTLIETMRELADRDDPVGALLALGRANRPTRDTYGVSVHPPLWQGTPPAPPDFSWIDYANHGSPIWANIERGGPQR